MKPLLTILGALVLSVLPWTNGFAQSGEVEEVTRLTLEHNDGTQSHYDLAEKPEISFEDDQLVITTPLVQSKVSRESLSHFHFTRGAASIAGVPASDYLFRFVNNRLTIAGSDLTRMSVYDINGMKMLDGCASEGVISADLSVLKSGVYIVNVVGKPSVKIIVK